MNEWIHGDGKTATHLREPEAAGDSVVKEVGVAAEVPASFILST